MSTAITKPHLGLQRDGAAFALASAPIPSGSATVHIEMGERSYPILIGAGLLGSGFAALGTP